MLTVFSLALAKCVVTVLLADLCSGIVHWIQDRYDVGEGSLLDRIVILYAAQHHDEPNAFTKLTWWQRNWFASVVVACVVAALWAFGQTQWELLVFVVVFMFSGEFHLWSHRAPQQNGVLVTFLQRSHLIQRPDHHWRHHADHHGYYCVITDVLNPVLNRVRFFDALEFLVERLTGARPRGGDHSPRHYQTHVTRSLP